MISINKRLEEYVVEDNSSIQEALQKINSTKNQVIFIVDSNNLLLGSFSDGDFRRYTLKQVKIDSSLPISAVMNSPCISLPKDTDSKIIRQTLDKKINTIPLIDKDGHLISIAEVATSSFMVGPRLISSQGPAFIIAEIGNNHQGDLNTAKSLVDEAKKAGADCVKFQMRNMDSLYGDKAEGEFKSEDLGSQYTLDLLSKYQLSNEDLFRIFDYSYEKEIIPLCTPWDISSLEALEKYGIEAYKVASADFTNHIFLSSIIDTGKLMFCSTGMSSEEEISKTVQFLNKKGALYILLHCNSTYPAPFKDVNLKYIHTLMEYSGNVVGYSGHERGISIPIAAVALGAKVIEKHFTLDRNQEGNDHKVSLLPNEFEQMVNQIRQVEEALLTETIRTISQGEMINRQTLAKSLTVNRTIKAGERISRTDLEVKSPGIGIQSHRIDEIIDKKVLRDIDAGSVLFETDFTGLKDIRSNYQFSRPYGIPVRFHDFMSMTNVAELDFVEFHLSYSDLEENPSDYISKERSTKMGFAVHAPELFEGDHVLDLASFDDKYRAKSRDKLCRVVDTTYKLLEFFPNTKKPIIVVNAGGWSVDEFISETQKKTKYELINESFRTLSIDTSNFEFAIQTMPPFPWQFGGQRFHNLFVNHSEINEFCNKTKMNICLDVSHSVMACNHYGWSIEEFIQKVAKHTVHIHISDAQGDDGEGIQMGSGDLNFESFIKTLNKFVPNVPFIPEVWQGHQNNGQGFWSALDFLERSKL